MYLLSRQNLVGTSIDEDVASLVASTLISTENDYEQRLQVGNFHTDSDNIHQSTQIRMVNMTDDISREIEETLITSFLQFELEDAVSDHPTDMKTIDCNHSRIGTFIT